MVEDVPRRVAALEAGASAQALAFEAFRAVAEERSRANDASRKEHDAMHLLSDERLRRVENAIAKWGMLLSLLSGGGLLAGLVQ